MQFIDCGRPSEPRRGLRFPPQRSEIFQELSGVIMAWNNQGGPWGGGGRGQGGGQSPWSRGPGGGGQPPDFEEMLRRGQDRMKNLVPGGMGPGKVGVLIGGLAILLWLASGLYQVQPSEVGVPLVFGKYSGETTENG